MINSTIKAIAFGSVCVCTCVWWLLQPNRVLHLGSAYQLKNQHNFPSLMRLLQIIWDLLNLCGLFYCLPLLNKISLPIRMLRICLLQANITGYSSLLFFFFFSPLKQYFTVRQENRTQLPVSQFGPVRFQIFCSIWKHTILFLHSTVNAILILLFLTPDNQRQGFWSAILFFSASVFPQKPSNLINEWSKCEQHQLLT